MASSSLLNSGVPKSMTYIAQNQSRLKMKRYKTGRTNGITSIGWKESKSVVTRTLYDVVEAMKSVSVQLGVEDSRRGAFFSK